MHNHINTNNLGCAPVTLLQTEQEQTQTSDPKDDLFVQLPLPRIKAELLLLGAGQVRAEGQHDIGLDLLHKQPKRCRWRSDDDTAVLHYWISVNKTVKQPVDYAPRDDIHARLRDEPNPRLHEQNQG